MSNYLSQAMKRIYTYLIYAFVLATVGYAPVQAQQESLYTQYMFNRLVVNPAYAGTKGVVSLTALYRHQWTGFDGAPRTFTVSGHGATSNLRHGFGAFIISDMHGVLRNSGVGFNYAFRIPLNSDNTFLSLGVQAAGLQYALTGGKTRTFESGDPVFTQADQSVIVPDFGTGVFLNSKKFYLGASIAHLVEFDINITGNNEDAKLARHFFVTSGYDFHLGKDFIITPSAFFRYVRNAPAQLDLNVNFMLIQKFWVGASYRTEDAVAFLAGFYPHNQFRIGYSYDLTTSDFRSANSNGSHEIMISFDFGNPNKTRVVTPRYF